MGYACGIDVDKILFKPVCSTWEHFGPREELDNALGRTIPNRIVRSSCKISPSTHGARCKSNASLYIEGKAIDLMDEFPLRRERWIRSR